MQGLLPLPQAFMNKQQLISQIVPVMIPPFQAFQPLSFPLIQVQQPALFPFPTPFSLPPGVMDVPRPPIPVNIQPGIPQQRAISQPAKAPQPPLPPQAQKMEIHKGASATLTTSSQKHHKVKCLLVKY